MQTGHIAQGVRYTAHTDPKFCSVLLELHFFLAHTEQTAAIASLLCDLLTASSAACPSRADLTDTLDALYAADFTAKLTQCGDAAMLSFSAEWLDDAHAPDGTPVTDRMLQIIYDCLSAPNAADGAFDAEEFRLCRQNLLDDIDCELNDRRGYALQKSAETAYSGEPAALPSYGSRAAAAAADPKTALTLWHEILQHAPVEVICIAPEFKSQIPPMLRRLFAHRGLCVPLKLRAPSPCKPFPERVTDTAQTVQSKLVMIYKYDGLSQDMVSLLATILGGAPNSLLFRNVRERDGLCYYCAALPAYLKSTLAVDVGVRADRIDAAEDAIEEQIEALRAGEIPEGLLEESLLHLEYREAVQEDSTGGIADSILRQPLYGDLRKPAERSAALRRITKQQLMDAAKQLRLDTVYILRGTAGEGDSI